MDPRFITPRHFKPLARNVYHRLFRARLRLRCWYADRFMSRDQADSPTGNPLPPAILRYRVCESISSDEFLRVGEGCANLIRRHLRSMGVDLAQPHRVLDFGCGCGRTVRWLAREPGQAEFHGVDVDREAIEWCTKHLRNAQFVVSSSEPPLPYPGSRFDAIYCLSVFTHLDESMQDIWLAELKRILKPNGVLLLTIHGAMATQSLDADGLEALKTTGFVHRRTKKLNGIVPEWYQTTWHSREYIVSRLSRLFPDVRYYEVSDGMQDIVMATSMACSSTNAEVIPS